MKWHHFGLNLHFIHAHDNRKRSTFGCFLFFFLFSLFHSWLFGYFILKIHIGSVCIVRHLFCFSCDIIDVNCPHSLAHTINDVNLQIVCVLLLQNVEICGKRKMKWDFRQHIRISKEKEHSATGHLRIFTALKNENEIFYKRKKKNRKKRKQNEEM